jgi:hypothetical protein
MRLLGTKSDAILSKLIRWASGDDCSHFAIHFEHLGMVLHSNLVGIHFDFETVFFAQNGLTVVHDVRREFTLDQELLALHEFEQRLEDRLTDKGGGGTSGSGYDFRAFAYQAWRLFLNRVFKKPIPFNNPWGTRDRFLCTELYDMMPDWVYPVVVQFEDLGMVRPSQMFAAMGGAIVL